MIRSVRVTHDAEADAAYVYLVDEIARGEVADSRVADIPLDRAALTVDFDADGRVLGIEVLGASRVLRPETLQAAEDITQRRH
jgi:uncharacterized protein YuzE